MEDRSGYEAVPTGWISIGAYAFNPEPIGRGSFADVFEGISLSKPSFKVAVKRIHKSRLAKASNRRLIDSEVQILKEMSHPHIVRLFDCITAPSDHICLVMEYCDGGDLNELIQRNAPMGEEQIASLVDQLASALHYLHERNIVHRDLKPQNILICLGADRERINLKLADFGFARHLLTEDMAATFCGSPLYMAPEVLEGGKYDAKADLWSLGIILFQCLTGHSPFRAGTIQELKEVLRKSNGRFSFPAGTSPSLAGLITGLLQISPEDRLSFDDFFDHAFLQHARALPHPASTLSASMLEEAPALTGSSSSGTILDDRSYVMVDKQFVELNAIADDLSAPTDTPAVAQPWSAMTAVTRGLRNTVSSTTTILRGGRPAGPTAAPEPPSQALAEQDLNALVLRIERVTRPAMAVMFVAGIRAASMPRPGAKHQQPSQRLEAMLLFSKALSIFRNGVNTLFASGGVHLARHPVVRPHVLELRQRFNECLRLMEELRSSSPPTMVNLEVSPPLAASVGIVQTVAEMIYDAAINLCRDAAADEAQLKLDTAEVAYSRALVLFNLLLSEATGQDVDVLNGYVQSTTRRLDAVVAKAKSFTLEASMPAAAAAALLTRTSPRAYVMSSPIPVPQRQADSQMAIASSPVFCGSCGCSIDDRHNFCVKCGSPRLGRPAAITASAEADEAARQRQRMALPAPGSLPGPALPPAVNKF